MRNAQKLILLSDRARILIEAVRAMPASGAAAIAAFEVELFGEHFKSFRRQVIIFAFDQFIFIILFLHTQAKIMFLIVSKYLIPKGFGGIAIFPFVILRTKLQANDPVYINHEKIHMRQQLQLLVLPFFIWYGLEFLIRFLQYRDRNQAYRNISFEREAYGNEKSLDYLGSRSWWKFLHYL